MITLARNHQCKISVNSCSFVANLLRINIPCISLPLLPFLLQAPLLPSKLSEDSILKGITLLVAADVDRPFRRTYDDVVVRFVNLKDVIGSLCTST